MKFDDLKRLRRGINRIDFEEFCTVLKRVLGACDNAYCLDVWNNFQDYPLQYMDSRQPQSQGQALFELAWRKGEVP